MIVKNISILVSGNVIAQALPILLSPILTRIYAPEYFGVSALFASIVLTLSSILSLKYESAIVSANDEIEAKKIFSMAMNISFMLTVVIIAFLYLFPLDELIFTEVKNEEIKGFIWLIPITALFLAIYNICCNFILRNDSYAAISKSRVVKSIALVVSQLLIGYFGYEYIGLIYSQIISGVVCLIYVYIILNKLGLSPLVGYHHFSFKLIKKYNRFPIYDMPSTLIFNLVQMITYFYIGNYYGATALGFYSLANRLLGLPGTLLGTAISQAIFQEMSKLIRCGESLASLFNKTLIILLSVTTVASLLIYNFIPWLFEFAFGEPWRIAGEYAVLLLPLFALRFIRASFNTVIIVTNKQRYGLIINAINLALVFFVFEAVNGLSLSMTDCLILLTTVLSIFQLLIILYYWKCCNYGY